MVVADDGYPVDLLETESSHSEIVQEVCIVVVDDDCRKCCVSTLHDSLLLNRVNDH
jgi:hypothetical protein